MTSNSTHLYKQHKPRTFTTTDGLIPADLLRSGLDHLSAAEVLFQTNSSFFDSAGYLVHLSIELMLKSWLLHSTGKFNRTHVLHKLHDELVVSNAIVALTKDELCVLGMLDKYEELRYPNTKSPTEVGNENLSAIKALAETIWNRLPQPLLDALDAIDPLRKGGRVLMKKKIEI